MFVEGLTNNSSKVHILFIHNNLFILRAWRAAQELLGGPRLPPPGLWTNRLPSGAALHIKSYVSHFKEYLVPTLRQGNIIHVWLPCYWNAAAAEQCITGFIVHPALMLDNLFVG